MSKKFVGIAEKRELHNLVRRGETTLSNPCDAPKSSNRDESNRPVKKHSWELQVNEGSIVISIEMDNFQ